MTSNTIGCITEFKPGNEKIAAYLERVQLFFEVNGIDEDKQVPVTYHHTHTDYDKCYRVFILATLLQKSKGFYKKELLKSCMLQHIENSCLN